MDITKEQESTRHLKLSTRQLRIFSVQNHAPTSTSYVETIAFKTKEDATAITKLFEKLLIIYPILNTEIRRLTGNDAPVIFCNISRVNEVSIEHVRRGESVTDYISRSIPVMKMMVNPLIKCRYIQTERFNVVVLHIHEIIADHMLIQRVSDNLQKLLQNEETIPSLLISSPYSTYLASEERYLSNTDLSSDEAFWREIFKTPPPDINLSVLPSSESVWKNTMAYKSKQLCKVFTTETTLAITKLSKEVNISNFAYYLSCAIVVLQRYLGVKDVTFQVPLSIRNDSSYNTDGLFSNTLLYRTTVNHQLTWREYIKRMAADWSSFMKHSQYPFEYLEQWILEAYNRPVASFCHVTLNYNKYHQSYDEISVATKHAKYPLSISILEDTNSEQTKIVFEWATDLIEDSIVENISCSLFELLTKPLPLEQKVLDSQVLSTSEMELINSFSRTKQPESAQFVKMNIMFENQAKIYPDNIALILDQDKLTYQQLNEVSSRIAHGIRGEIQLETLISKPVLLLLNKDSMAIAMVIGIWKAGGHFLSLPFSNKNELKLIVSQTSAAALIFNNAQGDDIEGLGGDISCPVISIYTLINCTYGTFLWSQESYKDQNSTAYMVRTSGSTGVPKVCKISHYNLNVIARAYTAAIDIDKYPITVFQWAPMTFGTFIGDLVRGLICGPGSLVICPKESRLDISYIQNSIRTNRVTFLELTPYFASKLIEGVDSRYFESLRVVIVGSDVVHRHVFRKLKYFLNPKTRVINGYGMSEATIDSTMLLDATVPCTRSISIPIGKPLLGVNLYVLDSETLLQCPVGTIGELYIGGDVIGSGDVDLINLGHGRGVALKTGEVCSWLPSGNIELFGREIVKFKGFRINTTEIESYIVNQCANAKEACVVILEKDSSGKQKLCALIEMDSIYREQTNSETVREILSKMLPQYMVPDIICFADAFPITGHGKIDRRTISAILDAACSNLVRMTMTQ